MRRSLMNVGDNDSDSSSDNDFYDLTYQERGQTRSGRRFAQANVGHYGSIGELLASHQRLLDRVSRRIRLEDGRIVPSEATKHRFAP